MSKIKKITYRNCRAVLPDMPDMASKRSKKTLVFICSG